MPKSSDNLKAVVGAKVYAVWLDMLKELVPWGRTHRLAVIVAGMLHYAAALAVKHKDADSEGSVAWNLVAATETPDPDEVAGYLMDPIQQLFRDARVRSMRNSTKGASYSIAEDAVQEFVRWEDMPWE